MTAAENKRADNSRPRAAGYRLCVYASGSLITDVCSSLTLISVSCLHLGQNKGKFSSTVSGRIFVRVLLLHTGHITHSILDKCFHLHPLNPKLSLERTVIFCFGTICPKVLTQVITIKYNICFGKSGEFYAICNLYNLLISQCLMVKFKSNINSPLKGM